MAFAATSIPTIDLSRLTPDSDSQAQISDAIRALGFLALTNPDVPDSDTVSRMFDISREFFLRETELGKAAVGIDTRNRGWVRLRQEALDVSRYPKGDLKEAFNLAHDFTPAGEHVQPLPPTLAAHATELVQFTRECHTLCMRLLDAFAGTLNLPRDFFTSRHPFDAPQGSVLRFLYYPPSDPNTTSSPNQSAQDIRAGAHSDYGSITLLFQQDVSGLQILLPRSISKSNSAGDDDDGAQWLDAPASRDTILVNLGDIFEFWTGGTFKSTVHRVVSPRTQDEASARFSIVYFLHPADDTLLSRMVTQPEKDAVLPDGADADADTERATNALKARFGVDVDAQLTAKEWLERRVAVTYSSRQHAGAPS